MHDWFTGNELQLQRRMQNIKTLISLSLIMVCYSVLLLLCYHYYDEYRKDFHNFTLLL